MKKYVIGLLAAGLICSSAVSGSLAAPIDGMSILNDIREASPVEQARVFCYNRFTGGFLHWGSCGGYYRPRVFYRPRVYCRNRFTGRFLHWGYC